MIPLYACAAGEAIIYQIDDERLVDDSGTPIEAMWETAPVNGAPFAKLRRLTQHVDAGGLCTVRLTPIADGADRTDQSQDIVIDPANGSDQVIEAAADVGGTTYAFRLDVLALTGSLALGSSVLSIIPRRSTRG